MSDLAHEIAAGDLSLRVPESGTSTEIDQLAGSFNVMVTRIEESFEAQRLSEMQARESEEQARESEERMRQFVADASHELRTPLTTIRGFAELAGEGATQPGTALSRIEDEAIRMGVLVNDLLLLARLDQQRPLEVAPVNALDVVTASVAGARVGAPERSIDVIVSEDHGPPIVLADEQRLRQVLDNLLVNALKHSSPASDVSVAVRTVRTGDGDGVEIAVTNSAPGMSAEVAERVFDRFYQSDPARSRVVGGSGLGLSIATAIVEAHGGRISLDTSVEGGTTFTVSLPCAPASPVQGGR
jgi:two-component system OmpR family sensor kinase